MLSEIGLVLIAIGWLLQLNKVWAGKNKAICPQFVAAYIAGVALLVVDGFQAGLLNLALPNALCIVFAALVLWKISAKA